MQAVRSSRKGWADDLGSLFLRVGLGVVFAWHGWLKYDGGVESFALYLGSLDGSLIGSLNDSLNDSLKGWLNVPSPEVVAWLQVIAEGIGGLLLIAGAFTRFVTVVLIAVMLGAIWLVKVHVGFIVTGTAGAELEAALLAGLLGLLFIGPGRLSLDSMLGRSARARRVSHAPRASVDA